MWGGSASEHLELNPALQVLVVCKQCLEESTFLGHKEVAEVDMIMDTPM